MPELPEVDALAQLLTERVHGRTIARVELTSLAALKTFDPPLHALEGQVASGFLRRGKFLIMAGQDLSLVIHFARAGWLTWREELPAAPTRPGKGPLALRVGFVSADGELAGGMDITEAGTAKGLALYVVSDLSAVSGIGRLGPDALELSAGELAVMLEAHPRMQIKGFLRDQSILSGIGNAYSDEILHAAKVSPFAACGVLDADVLHHAMVEVLVRARDHAMASDISSLKAEKREGLVVHGRAGQPCPICDDTIRTVSFADRSLEYCPTCQTDGRELADRRLSRLLK